MSGTTPRRSGPGGGALTGRAQSILWVLSFAVSIMPHLELNYHFLALFKAYMGTN